MRLAPRFNCTFYSIDSGWSLGIANDIITAGIKKFTRAGRNNTKKSPKGKIPFCQTINVVISPNELNVPPALAATTILIKLIVTNFGEFTPTASITAPINNAVVKLSAIGEIKKDKIPVIQNSCLLRIAFRYKPAS